MDEERDCVENGHCSSGSESFGPSSSENITRPPPADATETDLHQHYDRCYKCYWQQYSYLTSWVRKCQNKFRSSSHRQDFHEWCRLMSRYHGAMANYMQWNYQCAVGAASMQLGYDWHLAAFKQPPIVPLTPSSKITKKSGKGRRKRRRQSRARKRSLYSSSGDIELHMANIDPHGGQLELDLGDNNENVEFEFEITNDLVEFFAETARHRKQRELMKAEQLNETTDNELTNAALSSETAVCIHPTVLPPSEQLGATRLVEMRELYGAGAPMIHGMETAMQLSFDRNTDRYKPRPWPALPLNIRFS